MIITHSVFLKTLYFIIHTSEIREKMFTTKINFKYYHTIVVLIPFLIVIFRQLIIYLQDPAESVKILEGKLKDLNTIQTIPEHGNFKTEFDLNKTVVITAVACGGKDRFEELSVMMKSAIMYSQTQPLKFVIFTDQLGPNIEKILEYWKIFSKQHLSWEIRSPLFTNVAENQKSIKTCSTTGSCATQRLFFPEILPEYNYVIYADTDIIFLQDPANIWNQFENMSNKSFGLVQENNDPFYSMYTYSNLPHLLNGFNNGFMLMNLANLRHESWHQKMLIIHEELEPYFLWKDQDLINVYLHFYPSELFLLPCAANFRPDFCQSSTSKNIGQIEYNKGLILHGNRGAFHDKSQNSFLAYLIPHIKNSILSLKNIRIWESLFVNRRAIHKQGTFEAIYESFDTFNFGQDDFRVLKNDIEKRFLKVPNTDLCSHMKQILLKLLLQE